MNDFEGCAGLVQNRCLGMDNFLLWFKSAVMTDVAERAQLREEK